MYSGELNKVMLSCDKLEIGYSHKGENKIILADLNLQLHSGQLIALIGPNGSGKSTLIRTLCALQKSISGNIYIGEDKLNQINISKYIAIVLTSSVYAPNFTVFDMVSTGRIPHTNWLGRLGNEDVAIINRSIEAVGIGKLSDRLVSQLSDGERQKMMIAKALAQESPIIVLDEPTAHLDLVNRVEITKLLRELAHKENKAILMATHELDLAIQTADRIWLLESDKVHIGAPEDLIINADLQNAFSRMSIDFDHLSGSFRIKPQTIIPINYKKKEDSVLELWTERLLLKFGFYISNTREENLKLDFSFKDKVWMLRNNNENKLFSNLASLGDELRKIVFFKKK